MKRTLPHLIRTSDLFCNYDITKLKGKGNIKRKYKCKDKSALINRIFLRYLYILFSDLVQGGKIFLFPSIRPTILTVERLKREHFIAARKSGAYQDIDILVSNFTCYEFIITYYSSGHKIKMPVKLSHNFREIMKDKINTGYKYC